MSARSPFGKVLRSIGIISMGLTAGFTLLGGIGTSCVAFNPMGFGEFMSRLASMQWLYVIFVVVGIALGILGIRSVMMLVKGSHKSYQTALSVLIAGILAAEFACICLQIAARQLHAGGCSSVYDRPHLHYLFSATHSLDMAGS